MTARMVFIVFSHDLKHTKTARWQQKIVAPADIFDDFEQWSTSLRVQAVTCSKKNLLVVVDRPT